ASPAYREESHRRPPPGKDRRKKTGVPLLDHSLIESRDASLGIRRVRELFSVRQSDGPYKPAPYGLSIALDGNRGRGVAANLQTKQSPGSVRWTGAFNRASQYRTDEPDHPQFGFEAPGVQGFFTGGAVLFPCETTTGTTIPGITAAATAPKI